MLVKPSQPAQANRRSNKRPEVREKDIEGLKFFAKLRPLLDRLHDAGCARDRANNRTLHMDQYVMLVLLYLFNPTLTSLRGIQQASQLKKVQKKLGCARASLGSLSESVRVFDPELLKGVVAELGKQLEPIARDGRLGDIQAQLRLVDGSLLQGLPHLMTAALGEEGVRKSGGKHRLHTQFCVDKHIPTQIKVRPNLGGEHDERDVLADSLEAGLTYVMDRGYLRAALFNDIVGAGSSYVCRIRDNTACRMTEDRPLSDEAVATGVLTDQVVELGKTKARRPDHPVRVVCVKMRENPKRHDAGVRGGHGSDGVLRVATNLLDLPAETVALVYEYRWTVEIFFRFFKHVLGCRHLLSHKAEGIRLQTYAAIIACMLMTLWTGRRPSLRTYEMICHYFSGLADWEELMLHIEHLPKHEDPAKTN